MVVLFCDQENLDYDSIISLLVCMCTPDTTEVRRALQLELQEVENHHVDDKSLGRAASVLIFGAISQPLIHFFIASTTRCLPFKLK